MSKDICFGRAIFSQVFKVILHQVFTPSGKTSKLSFLSLPLNLHGTLFLSTSMAAPSQPYYGVFRPLSGHSPARISIPKQPPSIGYHFPSSKSPNIISISTYFKIKVSDFNLVLWTFGSCFLFWLFWWWIMLFLLN